MSLAVGIYDVLLDEELRGLLEQSPEIRSVIGKLDVEEEPGRYSWFVARVLERALRQESDPAARRRLCNELIARIAASPDSQSLGSKSLAASDGAVLLEVTPPSYATK